MSARTNIYVDGFNLYYGRLKHSPFKWLDLRKLCALVLPAHLHSIHQIRYFTAIVHPRSDNPNVHVRQLAYLRALRASGVSVHLGKFLNGKKKLPLATPTATATHAEVRVTQEKGSDVNLATYLLIDAFQKNCEAVVVISNDTDLKEPIRYVNHELGIKVGLILPRGNMSNDLKKVVKFSLQFDDSQLRDSQFPERMADEKGKFFRPPEWRSGY